jgi:hypothetical protein
VKASRVLDTSPISNRSPRPRSVVSGRPFSADTSRLDAQGWVAQVFGADLRSLAALRMVLALVVLANLVNGASSLSALYTDDGVLPRQILLNEMNRWQFSLNLINGTLFVQTLLFGIAAVAALALLAGYRTRLMTAVVWVMMLSIQARNPFVLNAADTLLRLLLFWSIFLPLGARWSVDHLRHPPAPRATTQFVSFATFGLFLQIAFMYPIAAHLLHFPALLKVLRKVRLSDVERPSPRRSFGISDL